ncbi:DNA-binding response regulator [Sphaerisporangium melleum]|uniref:DNA-binding response regulator n=1 Tax=Sphaerisporangium melleum TaxID=321316 RepID=A0A917VRI7_9ACTN|nr:DNA-binding response regulator [Sphaerisporangium melleum]GII71717.1 DNA-binding response regulator [Sphaerisporangium melleum]
MKSVNTGAEALKAHRSATLVLLDLELPDIDGLEVCRAIRDSSNTPIISFAGRDTELDRVLALQAGADDCVSKPCGLREVVARIEALMRRAYPRVHTPQSISLCPLHIDSGARKVHLNHQEIDVTAKEFDLLYILAANPERVVSRKDLMKKVWESDGVMCSRTIDTHVSSLRAKLGSEWIVTVRGVGYRIGQGYKRTELRRDDRMQEVGAVGESV